MKKSLRTVLSILLIMILVLNSSSSLVVYATNNDELEEAIMDTAKYMYRTVQSPEVGCVEGEWAVFGLARSGCKVPKQYYNNYYNTVEEYVKECDGNLHDKKYTEYSRLIVALSSIGKDARNVAGYNLTTALGDYDKTIWQGLNGPIWALIALDSANYPMPVNDEAETQATRDMYIQTILDCQLEDGGWSLFGGGLYDDVGPIFGHTTLDNRDIFSDPDITGMALQALAKYQDRLEVKQAIEEALICMSKQQNSEGGFFSWGTVNSESCVQMIVALCELGIPLDDPRFVKNGKTILDSLMTFYIKGKGFLHTKECKPNQMASEQGLYGLVAANRILNGKNSIYRMTDKVNFGGSNGNNDQLLWPADSSEVTLWFGQIDEQYTAVNKGINIQGRANSNVYSVCDGVVAYTGYSSTYGNLLYVNFKYNNILMQVRYGHLSEASKLKIGDVVKSGDLVGKMGRDANTGKGLIEIVFCESQDGMICNINGENIQFVDPIHYLDRPMCDITYLEKDMATILDTTGLVVAPVAPCIIWPWEDKNDPDIRYRENKDLNLDETYLRKLIVEYGREIDKSITHKNIGKKGIITYKVTTGIATVNLNGRSKKYGVSLGNAEIKNNRMVVDREQVWYDLIGRVYNYPEGGTWYANNKLNPICGGVLQCIYMPKDIAEHLYVLTENGQVPQLFYDKAKEIGTGVGVAAATKEFSKMLSTEYGIKISASKIGLFASVVVFCYDLAKAYERNSFLNAINQCGDNEFVRISCFLIPYEGMVYSYRSTKEIKDVYRSTGTFKPGYFEFNEVN